MPPTQRRRARGAAAVASLLPLAMSMIPTGTPEGPSRSRRAPTPKEFTIPVNNLRDWADAVVVTIDDVEIEGNSKIHRPDADCELHFGAQSPKFKGDPPGLVLEPMNVCIQPFPGKTEYEAADWLKFAADIKGTTVTVSGVPRIWPEHLSGGGGPSNPDHAVEIHPLTAVVFNGQNFDFSANVFAGEYSGGVRETTAVSIVDRTAVSVTRNSGSVTISFSSGTIGNFTLLDIVIERASIEDDGAGSFRMNGNVVLDSSNAVPVRIVTVRGSPANDEIKKIQAGRRANVSMEQTLVLFSLSPEALLAAANKSRGDPVEVERPLQLILYGPPD